MAGDQQPRIVQLAAAWGVHLFTSLGVVIALLALLAIERDEARQALLWLLLALAVDGVDGTLARAARVGERLPRIDGAALDLIIDYLTYVFLPALFLLRGGYLPAGLDLLLCAAILSSSLYVFARRDMKTEDGYFRGFPGLWNVVAFYVFVMQPDPVVTAVAIALLLVMTFAPVHVVHPFRVRDYGRTLPALAILWTATTTALLFSVPENLRLVITALSLGSALLLIGMGLLRTLRGPRPAAQ